MEAKTREDPEVCDVTVINQQVDLEVHDVTGGNQQIDRDVHDVTGRHQQVDSSLHKDSNYSRSNTSRQQPLKNILYANMSDDEENYRPIPLPVNTHCYRTSFYPLRQENKKAREGLKKGDDEILGPCYTGSGRLTDRPGNSRAASAPPRSRAVSAPQHHSAPLHQSAPQHHSVPHHHSAPRQHHTVPQRGFASQEEAGQLECTISHSGIFLKSDRSESKYDVFSARNRSEGSRTEDLIKLPQSARRFRSVTSARKSRDLTCNISTIPSLLPPSDAKDPNAVYMDSIRRIYDVTEAKRRKEEQYRNLVMRQMYLGNHSIAECTSYLKYLERSRNVSSANSNNTARR